MTRHSVRRPMDGLRWLVVSAALFAMCSLWAIATPAMSSPDEPSHAVKAVAVAHGELVGDIGPRPTTWMIPGAMTTVEIPADYATVADLGCYVAIPDQDASCMPALPSDHTSFAEAQTAAGHYPPLYYLLVGWPSTLMPADPGILVMRLVSGAVSTIFVVAGLIALRATRASRVVRWGAVTALTPMSLFLFGTINPNGLEISAAFAAWASIWAVFRARGQAPKHVYAIAAVSFAVLANVRGLSPLWAIVIVAIAALGSGQLGALWRDRRPLLLGSFAFVAVVSLPAILWSLRYGTLLTGEGIWPQYQDRVLAVTDMVLSLSRQYEQMIGNQGWFDSPVPLLTLLVWTISLGMLAAHALQRRGQVSGKLALCVLFVGVVVGPMLIQLPGAADAGLVWQGRYTLPIAIGLPLLAAWLISAPGGGEGTSVAERIARGMIPALGVAHVLAFYGTARRYAVGIDGPYATTDPAWSSNLGFMPAVVIYGVAVAVFLIALSGPRRPGAVEITPDPATGGTAAPAEVATAPQALEPTRS
ncbi:DUF2142 domain-containing protein [Oerskovia sp. USHLN155]|uniref:DUF2142 domain-containing protein n=1 Tax=Oerskovia sp. USHLN155 TaxID=3081288 RepID=UPI00301746F6